MKKRIGVIHQSEIIRKGLSTILRSFFNLEIHNFSGPDILFQQQNLLASLSCIIIESDLVDHINLNALKVNNELKIITYLNSSKESRNAGSDEQISNITPSVELQEIISRCIKSKESGNASYSGSELSIREQDVLKLIALGYSNKEIADQLFISIHTVISHRKNITEKLGIKSIPGLTVYAILNKLINTENINPENLI